MTRRSLGCCRCLRSTSHIVVSHRPPALVALASSADFIYSHFALQEPAVSARRLAGIGSVVFRRPTCLIALPCCES